MKSYDRFYLALNLLVDNVLFNISSNIKDMGYQPKVLLKEFLTVKISSGRRSGTTVNCLRIGERFRNPLYISTYPSGCIILRKTLQNHPEIKIPPNICTMRNFEGQRGKSSIDAIILDGASMLSKKDVEDIYDFALGCNSPGSPILIFAQ